MPAKDNVVSWLGPVVMSDPAMAAVIGTVEPVSLKPGGGW